MSRKTGLHPYVIARCCRRWVTALQIGMWHVPSERRMPTYHEFALNVTFFAATSLISSNTIIHPAARIRQIFVPRRIEGLTEKMDATAVALITVETF